MVFENFPAADDKLLEICFATSQGYNNVFIKYYEILAFIFISSGVDFNFFGFHAHNETLGILPCYLPGSLFFL